MNDSIKIALTIISSCIGLYSGFVIVMPCVLLFFKLIETVTGFNLEAMWLLIGILAFTLGMVSSIIASILFGMISLGKFNSEKWRINRFYLMLTVLIVGLISHYFFLAK